MFGLVGVVGAAVNAVTPSTNDANRTNGWAHVNQLSRSAGETELQFVSTRNFLSCFEYRTDGDISQALTTANPNPAVADRYPSLCVSNSTSTRIFQANEYVEIRMVFGAETDERFDWTRFDVDPVPSPRSAEITSPTAGQEVSGTVSFDAVLTDDDDDDSVQWAVRRGTCAAGTNTVLGNVDGFNDPFTWNGTNFHATADTSSWTPGDYCFVFNPSEGTGEADIRETREFEVVQEEEEDTTAPLVTIKNPDEGDTVSGRVRIKGIIREDEAMGNYNIAIYEGGDDFMDFSQRLEQRNVTVSNGKRRINVSYRWDTTSYPDGEYLIRLAARDKAGNRDLTGDPFEGGDDSQHVIRVTVNNHPDNEAQCRRGQWRTFFDPGFRSERACIRWVRDNVNPTPSPTPTPSITPSPSPTPTQAV